MTTGLLCPGFRSVWCCFDYSRSSCMAVFVFCSSVHPPYQFVDDTRLSPFCQLLTLRTDQPLALPWFFVFAWAVFVWFLFCLFAVLSFLLLFFPTGLVTANWTVYWCQFYFCSPPSVKMDNVTARWRKPIGVGRKKNQLLRVAPSA